MVNSPLVYRAYNTKPNPHKQPVTLKTNLHLYIQCSTPNNTLQSCHCLPEGLKSGNCYPLPSSLMREKPFLIPRLPPAPAPITLLSRKMRKAYSLKPDSSLVNVLSTQVKVLKTYYVPQCTKTHFFLFAAKMQDFAFRLYKIHNFILSRIPSVQELKEIFPSPLKISGSTIYLISILVFEVL